MVVKLGDKVLICNRFIGIVRFLGEVKFRKGLIVGAELEKPVGHCNGSVNGETYFTCAENLGLFARERYVEEFDAQKASVFKIQSRIRGVLGRIRAIKTLNSHVWNILDNNMEQLMLRRGDKIKSHSVLGAASSIHLGLTSINTPEDDLSIDHDYDGAHLVWPLTLDNVLQVLDSFKNGKVLHYKYVREVLNKARKALSSMPTLQDIPVAEGNRLTICGDTHGQLQDVYSVFTINGLPSPTNQYLFNGDFVDRGDCGVEVVITLLLFRLLYSNSMWLNRGNHESRSQNSWMGFEEEVLWKYSASGKAAGKDKGAARALYNLFQTCFDALPLCSVVAEKIFVCHGGLFNRDGVTLAHLKGIKRKREPPLHGLSFEEQLMEELLWSDPRPIRGRQQSERGAGVEFGADVTNGFCSTNRIALVIRSHECVREGFQIQHGGRLITLFSASRYCGTQTNKGAFLTLGPDLQPEIQQFFAHAIDQTEFESPVPPAEGGALVKAGDARAAVGGDGRLAAEAVQMILGRVIDQKSQLYWFFTQADESKKGRVSRLAWAQGMRTTLDLNLPFLLLQKRLVSLEADGTVDFTRFLERYRIEMAGGTEWQGLVIDRICRRLYQALGSGDITAAFRFFDVDQDGSVDYDEFLTMLRQLDIGLTDDQIYELMRSADTNRDGQINMREFAARFEMSFAVLKGEMEFDEWTKNALLACGRALLTQQEDVAAAFKRIELQESAQAGPAAAADALAAATGNISYASFVAVLKDLDLPFSDEEFNRIATAVDADRSGFINYNEFIAAFKIADKHKADTTATSGSAPPVAPGGAAAGGGGAPAAKSGAATTGGGFETDDESNGPVSGGGAAPAGGGPTPSTVSVPAAAVATADNGSWEGVVLQQVANVLFQHRIHIRSAFRMFDVDNSGEVSAEEFRSGLGTINALLDRPLTNEQMDGLLAALDRNGDGVLSYAEFFDGFRIVDSETERAMKVEADAKAGAAK